MINLPTILFFAAIVATSLYCDFRAHSIDRNISLREAVSWSVFYIVVSVLFAIYLMIEYSYEHFVLFITGWGLEKALAIDNLVVFAAIFSYFGIRDKYQHRVLYVGIIGAIVLRFVFVGIGTGLVGVLGPFAEFAFGCIILYTAYLMCMQEDDEEVDYDSAWYIRRTKRWLPVTSEMDGSKFFINGRATRLVLALVAIEISDIMFSFDSVPAVIAVTKDPFLVYSAIIFAVLGLRSLYFVLSALARGLEYFQASVIAVLIFIALKMFLKAGTGLDISPLSSLIIVFAILSIGVIRSLCTGRKSYVE